ncbi:MAG: TonB-dependent receptor plug domain-containing protein, partial [Rhodospirillaceae bacterium]|nr:TonB-dependent receptor plug domain-containing protein [Rhodospirillaceae bacterium]
MKQGLLTSYFRRLTVALPLVCMAATTALHAQDAGELEEIVVTGSYLARPADQPRPVSIMEAAEIRANQRVSLTEVVRDMPQISTANVTNNWENATNSINMRGLGSRST